MHSGGVTQYLPMWKSSSGASNLSKLTPFSQRGDVNTASTFSSWHSPTVNIALVLCCALLFHLQRDYISWSALPGIMQNMMTCTAGMTHHISDGVAESSQTFIPVTYITADSDWRCAYLQQKPAHSLFLLSKLLTPAQKLFLQHFTLIRFQISPLIANYSEHRGQISPIWISYTPVWGSWRCLVSKANSLICRIYFLSSFCYQLYKVQIHKSSPGTLEKVFGGRILMSGLQMLTAY